MIDCITQRQRLAKEDKTTSGRHRMRHFGKLYELDFVSNER